MINILLKYIKIKHYTLSMLDFIFIYYLSGADTDISVVNCVKVIINNNDFPSSCHFPSKLRFNHNKFYFKYAYISRFFIKP
jgi:hypothetical protein